MLLIKGGRLMDPASGTDARRDILIDNGRIKEIGKGLSARGADVEVLNVEDSYVVPGLVDIHVHFREPGHEYKEDIASGHAAAAAGGFTTVVAMPNTNPPIDQAAAVQSVLERSRRAGLVNLYPVGCATMGRRGEALTEYGDMKQSGIVAVSDDGDAVENSQMLRRVLEYARTFGLPYISHCEDSALANRGFIHEGEVSLRLGLRGIPREAESLAVQKEIILARMTSGRIHFTHISAWESVEAIRRAKKEGLTITMDVTPHHLFFTDKDAPPYDTNFKMNPPLREDVDRDALLKAVEDGTADAIVTDHAPHAPFEKEVEFKDAPFGVIGLETCLPVLWELHKRTGISWMRWLELITIGPARVLGLPAGKLEEGGPADVTVFRTGVEYTMDPSEFRSKARNTPFAGMTFDCRVEYTVCGGKVVFKREGA